MRTQELTNVEKDVLQMMWDNLSTAQIAKVKGASPSWVRKTYERIHYKLNTYTRMEMIRCALKKGIIEI